MLNFASWRRGSLSAVAGLCLLFGAGCGGCDDDSSGSQPGGDAGDVCVGADCPGADGGGSGDRDSGPPVSDGGSSDGSSPDGASQGDGESDVDESCAPENTCGSACCGDDELCLGDSCVLPGDDCTHNLECAQDEICEPMLEKCIPDPGVVCEWRPPTAVFEPEVVQAWGPSDQTPEPDFKQVVTTPLVMDINDDGVPDIIFSGFRDNSTRQAILRAVDGRTYDSIFDLVDEEKRVSGNAPIAVGDIDGDGKIEIVALRPGGQGIIVIDDYSTNWDIKWEATDFSMSNSAGATLADLDGDGRVEVIVSNRVYDGKTGDLLCVASDLASNGRIPVAADLNGDGNQEVLVHDGAFRFVPDGEGGYDCPTYWKYSGGGTGFAAVADFGTFTGDQDLIGDLDGIPEVVTADGTKITLSNGQTGEAIWSSTIPRDGHPIYSEDDCKVNGVGPPTIAHFTGGDAPEIGAAGACFYVAFNPDGSLLWKHPSQDLSSRITGSSVFDFEGDGKAEVVYADECFLRVYDGEGNGDGTTTILYERSNTSGTVLELPVIVDVDGDFHADIVYVTNTYGSVSRCEDNWPDFETDVGAKNGVHIARDVENRWVSTRPVWNQHAYSVTNVCDGIDDNLCPGRPNKAGAIPIGALNNWDFGHLNNFRQNVQGDGLFNAPDFEMTNAELLCEREGVKLQVTIANRGTLGVLAGVNVAIWASVDGTEQYVTTLQTTRDLPPGASETLEYDWDDASLPAGADVSIRAVADSDEDGNQLHHECNEDNNEITSSATCRCETDDDCEIDEVCLNVGVCVPRSG